MLKHTRFSLAPALVGLALMAAACSPAVSAGGPKAEALEILDARSLIHALHDRYAADWYRTLSFKQLVFRPAAPGEPEVWVEYAEVPGRLRIEFDGGDSGNGVIFAGDSLYVFRADSLVRRAAQRNPLMLLGFDMYVQPPERTLELLRGEGFDLARFHRTSWEGRTVYVIGAEPGDLRSPQFWVEEDRLLFVRLIQPTGQDGSRTSDIRFREYEPLGGGWIAPVVVFLVDGEVVMREEYFDMAADIPLDSRLFQPEQWGEMR